MHKRCPKYAYARGRTEIANEERERYEEMVEKINGKPAREVADLHHVEIIRLRPLFRRSLTAARCQPDSILNILPRK